MSRISFDYDGTLTEDRIKKIAINLIDEGEDVFIVTARPEAIGAQVKSLARSMGIPLNRVIFTGGKDKVDFLKRLNIDEHYDNNSEQIKKIRDNSSIKTHLV